jgi:hypothetical protein
MVLESRQTHTGENVSNYREHASNEPFSVLEASKLKTEWPHQNTTDIDRFQKDVEPTESYGEDEMDMQPKTKSQTLPAKTNSEAIKTTSGVKERRKKDFTKESKQISNIDEFPPRKHQKMAEQDCAAEQRQMGDGQKPLMMSRAQLYAALSNEPEQVGRRMNPNKGKFFFGSTIRLYGGSRWSELRQKAQGEHANETVTTCQEFELDDDIEQESKKVKNHEPPIADDDTSAPAEERIGSFITMVENLTPCQQSSVMKGYQGNWKATVPAFIVITNALFTVDC